MPKPEGRRYYYRGNVMTLVAVGPKTKADGSPLAGAAATVTFLDRATMASVPGATWPVVGTWDATRREYAFLIPSTLVVTEGQALIARIELDGGATAVYADDVDVIVRYQRP